MFCLVHSRGRPVVPLSREKNVSLSLCPGTRAGAKIPGQTVLNDQIYKKELEPTVEII